MAVAFHATLTLKDGRELLIHRPDVYVEVCEVEEGVASEPMNPFQMGALGLTEDDVCFFYEAINFKEISDALQRNFPGCTDLVVSEPVLKPTSVWRLGR